jgi:transcriptional regulator with XRE-family HTH domain
MDGPTVVELVADAAAAVSRRAALVSEDVYEVILREIPELRDDKPVLTLLNSSVHSNIETCLEVMRHRIDLGDVQAPAAALEYARRLAQRGTSLPALLRSYRLGHACFSDWFLRELADYVVARRVELGMRDRRALAEATGVTERTLGKLENGQHVSASTLGMVENRLGWAPGSWRRILAGGEPKVGSPDLSQPEYEDPTLWHIASTPGLPPDVVRGLVALARNWRQGDDGTEEHTR